jgi:hypothetical protein
VLPSDVDRKAISVTPIRIAAFLVVG